VRLPFLIVAIDPFEPGGVAGNDIAPVLGAGALAQICDAIVGAYSVAVIDLPARMLAVNVEPGEPVLQIKDPVDPDRPISPSVPGSRLPARGGGTAPHSPVKPPHIRDVPQQLSQPLVADASLPLSPLAVRVFR
jgi:hypothetical protein